jgi:hypothetical protein
MSAPTLSFRRTLDALFLGGFEGFSGGVGVGLGPCDLHLEFSYVYALLNFSFK